MPTIRFAPSLQTAIPCLSWCVRMRKGDPVVLLHHGRSVEVKETAFSDGVWDSQFSQSDFAKALFFTGSGASITSEGLEFATAMHTLAPVFLIKLPTEVIISNSLAFLLEQAGDDLDLKYKFYAHDLMSIMAGIRKYVRSIPTRCGNRVELFYFCNFTVDALGEVVRKEKPAPPSFGTYKDYCGFLEQQIAALAKNATDPARRIHYEPITTISSGFDSPASSLFARAVGCKRAITFKLSRDAGSDSGKEIAERLGMEVLELDREEYRNHPGADVEFLASGTGGEDMVMAPLANVLADKLLFTGFYGLVWDRINPDVGPDILKSDASGCSMEEFRLRVGFQHLPVPYLGCVRHEDIHRISNSSAMKPWTTADGSYDKPIPRRLLEDAGIPGQLFGQKKKAVTQPFITVCRDDPPARNVLSDKSFVEFSQFVRGTVFFESRAERAWLFLMRSLYRLNRFLLRACRQAGFGRRAETVVSGKFRKRITENHLIFPWALSRMKKRYRLPGE